MLVDVLSMLGVDISDPSMALQRLATRSYTFLTQVLPNLFGGVMRFTSGLLDVVVGIIIAIYLLLSKEVFYAQVKKLLFAFFPRRVAQATLNLTPRQQHHLLRLYLRQDSGFCHHRRAVLYRM